MDQILTSNETSMRAPFASTPKKLSSGEEHIHIISDHIKGLEDVDHSRDENEISGAGEVDTLSDPGVIDDSLNPFDKLTNGDEDDDALINRDAALLNFHNGLDTQCLTNHISPGLAHEQKHGTHAWPVCSDF